MYAVIVTGGKQYKVAEGDVLYIEKLGVDADSEVTFDNVLAVSTDKGFKAGKDAAKATVNAKVLKNVQSSGYIKRFNLAFNRA